MRPTAGDITDAMDVPMRQIMALPAFTFEGLAVKARAALFAFEYAFDRDLDELDWTDLVARHLIESILNTAARSA